MDKISKIVRLNVGGVKYKTTLDTLTKQPNSYLSQLFSDENLAAILDEEENVFLDRDGKTFRYILQILRGPNPVYPSDGYKLEALLQELRYFKLGLSNDNSWGLTDLRTHAPGFYASNRPIMFRTKFFLQWLTPSFVNDEGKFVVIYIFPKEISDTGMIPLCEMLKKGDSRGIQIRIKFNCSYLFTFDAIEGKILIREKSEVIKEIPANFPQFTLILDNAGTRGVEFSLLFA